MHFSGEKKKLLNCMLSIATWYNIILYVRMNRQKGENEHVFSVYNRV